MIWFACKQCGKRHGRADHLSGTLVFCECGQGNRVPWSSTVAEPEPEETSPLPPSSPPRRRTPFPSFDDDRSEPSFPRRRRERRRIHPGYCLNHEDAPKEAICAACRCSFCSACVVTLQGQTLCGPCKNFRVGGVNRPSRLSSLALVAFILGLVSFVVSLFLTFIALGAAIQPDLGLAMAIFCCLLALVFAGGELVLSWLAARQIERQPALSGRALAMTGLTAGLTSMVWAAAITVFSIARQIQG